MKINPSIDGWIDKYFTIQKPLPLAYHQSIQEYYQKIQNTGFIYGYVVSIDFQDNISIDDWTPEERSKVALFDALLKTYQIIYQNIEKNTLIQKLTVFYKEIQPKSFNPLELILSNDSHTLTLEKTINQRVQTNNNIISKQFSPIITNALLFIDVLAFYEFLKKGKISHHYTNTLEKIFVTIILEALTTKIFKSEYDELLIKLFEASIRFHTLSEIKNQDKTIIFNHSISDLEKYYIIDLVSMALWHEKLNEQTNFDFLYQFGNKMAIDKTYINKSIDSVIQFIKTYKEELPLFNYSHPMKTFYDQTTKNMILLINRNKRRLIKEITKNANLMKLLAYSTQRELNEIEKKKVRKQLLNICKTIPSLTIFLLPGGSLLLPILIKFIPNLLPSSFNENLED